MDFKKIHNLLDTLEKTLGLLGVVILPSLRSLPGDIWRKKKEKTDVCHALICHTHELISQEISNHGTHLFSFFFTCHQAGFVHFFFIFFYFSYIINTRAWEKNYATAQECVFFSWLESVYTVTASKIKSKLEVRLFLLFGRSTFFFA